MYTLFKVYFSFYRFNWAYCLSEQGASVSDELNYCYNIITFYYSPETGQALYQEPDTIKREVAPTGDLYAQPDKPRRNAPSKPEESSKELPTYQDPNTIQRTQAPAMDYLYSEVEKKKEQQMYAQVDKERVS